MLISKNRKLCAVLDKVDAALVETMSRNHQQENRDLDPAAVRVEDYDCSLCFRFVF